MHSHAQTSTEIDNNPIRYRPVSFSYSFSGNGAAKFSKKCLVSARVSRAGFGATPKQTFQAFRI
jgi:hypothetical protein